MLCTAKIWLCPIPALFCWPQRSTSVRTCMNSSWTCCWRLWEEHVSVTFLVIWCVWRSWTNSMCLTLFVISAEFEEVVEFLEEVIASLLADQEVRTFGEVMVPVFDIFQGRVKDLDLCQLLLYSYLEVLLYFSRQKDISKVRIQCSLMLTSLQFLSEDRSTFFGW